MLNFTLMQPINFIYGDGKTADVAEVVQAMGRSKPMLVFDQGVKAAGIVDKVVKALESAGIPSVLYDKVQSDPPVAIVEAGYEFAKKEGIDSIIAVGGGSSMDTAKGINVLLHNPGPLMDYAAPMAPMERCLGLVVIPTTSGTGSELSNGLVVTAGDGSKILMLNTQHYPEYVIVDPENYAGMPQELTKLVGLDALTHGCESHQTILSNLPSMMISEKVVQMVIEWLPRSVKDGKDLEARAYMAVAASLGGWALTLAAACAGHSFGHVLGAKLHLPHGAMVAYALPFVMEWNARAVPDKVKRIGTLFGVAWGGSESAEEIGKKTRAAIERFVYEDVGLKKFREWGPDPALKDEIAAAIVAEVAMPLTPEQVPLDVVKRILDELYAM